MGLWSLLTNWRRKNRLPRGAQLRGAIGQPLRDTVRQCRFELMEERRLLDADPIKIGVTYLEADSGGDHTPDTFQIMFQGGAEGTEVTRLVIDGDHGPTGLSVGDMIFDTVKGGLGADEAVAAAGEDRGRRARQDRRDSVRRRPSRRDAR